MSEAYDACNKEWRDEEWAKKTEQRLLEDKALIKEWASGFRSAKLHKTGIDCWCEPEEIDGVWVHRERH